MRPLTDDETRLVFSKLAHYIGNNVVHLVDSTGEASSSSHAHDNDGDDASEGKGQFVFRLHRDRVYYVDEMAMKLAGAVSREKLCSLGTCLGKFSKSGNK